MALLFIDGFDAGDASLKWSSSNSPNHATITPYSAGRSLYLNAAQSFATYAFSPVSQIYTGFAIRRTSLSSSYDFLVILADNAEQTHLSLSFTPAGAVILKRGSTQIATSSDGLVTVSGWSYIELSATIADSGGRCIVRIDEAIAIDFTGDTKNAGVSTNIDGVTLRGASANTTHIDDFYLCDSTGSAPYNTFLGKVRIDTLTPQGAGASTEFTPSSGTNHSAVDELPFSAADYVTGTTSGTRDTYALSDLLGNPTVLGVQNNIIAKKTDAGSAIVKPVLVSGGTTNYGPDKTLGSSDVTVSDLYTIDPATSTSWTLSGINNLEAGVEIA